MSGSCYDWTCLKADEILETLYLYDFDETATIRVEELYMIQNLAIKRHNANKANLKKEIADLKAEGKLDRSHDGATFMLQLLLERGIITNVSDLIALFETEWREYGQYWGLDET